MTVDSNKSDFERNVWCLLGIPVDAISYDEALTFICSAIQSGRRCFFSTPNLNFIVEANKDEAFRDSVICSNLVLLDGMPPVWVARLLGIRGIEKVSGSNLIESLWCREAADGRKIRVYLFGGEEGVAARACERMNTSSPGFECVGFQNPGFGSVVEMSDDGILDLINQSKPELLMVSLGAKKGQAWIQANLGKLDAPVVSHLGAVVNFAAGRIARAPRWMQNCGTEWLWRILQEPGLWRRYLLDGFVFIGLIFRQVLPYRVWQSLNRPALNVREPVRVRIEISRKASMVYLEGACLFSTIGPLREVFRRESAKAVPMILDMTRVPVVDGAFLALCLLLWGQTVMQHQSLRFIGVSTTVRRIFNWNGVDWLL